MPQKQLLPVSIAPLVSKPQTLSMELLVPLSVTANFSLCEGYAGMYTFQPYRHLKSADPAANKQLLGCQSILKTDINNEYMTKFIGEIDREIMVYLLQYTHPVPS